jgi:hypothetical protein
MHGAFIGKRLKPLATSEVEWQLWQYKSLNMHRGVLHWDATAQRPTLSDIRDSTRNLVAQHYRPAWWRGFGFGAIVSLTEYDPTFAALADLVDVRNDRRGAWQWIVLEFPTARAAVGVCTWTEGYLAPVYRDLLAQLTAEGYDCRSYQREPDALVKALLEIHEKLRIVHYLASGLG